MRLSNRRIAFGLALGILCLPAIASAIILPPTAQFLMDDGNSVTTINIPVSINVEQPGTFVIDNWFFTHSELELTINAFFDPDPEIIYAMSVIDFGGPTTFGFVFSQGIVPTAAPGVATHTHSSSTTDGGGAAGTLVTALAPPAIIPVDAGGVAEIAVYTLSTNGGTTFLNAGMDLNPSFTGAAPSDTQGPFSEGPIAGPAGSGSYDVQRIDVNFMMDGSNDSFTFNGRATINAPEPASTLLLGLGLAGLAASRRLRRR